MDSYLTYLKNLTGFTPKVTKDSPFNHIKLSKWEFFMLHDTISSQRHFMATKYSQLLPTARIINHLFNHLCKSTIYARNHQVFVPDRFKFQAQKVKGGVRLICFFDGQRQQRELLLRETPQDGYSEYVGLYDPVVWATYLIRDLFFIANEQLSIADTDVSE